MKVVKDLANIKDSLGATIGNFDGVHRGHQFLLKCIKSELAQESTKFCVITFTPHPAFILKNSEHFLINSYEERRDLLADEGVDYLYEIEFTRDFSTLSPAQFFDQYLFQSKSIQKLYLGHDFAFGANKSGDYKFASEYCKKLGIDLHLLDEFKKNTKQTISSTIVRNLIQEGKVSESNEMLGRPFFLRGRIIKGEGRGKKIGVPTANIQMDVSRLIPRLGVFVTETMVRGTVRQSVTNVGVNPTFSDGKNKINVETHIFDFDEDIYGEEVEVRFLKMIRDEKKFDHVEALVNQIHHDINTSKEYFQSC